MSTETENGTVLTFDKSGQAMFPELTAGASALPVRTSPSQESERDLTETEAALSEKCSVFLANLKRKTDPNGLSTRMLRGCCRAIEGGDFLSIILAMEELGYDVEWQVFNSKYHGVPQNRERVYTLGHLRTRGERKVFPLCGADGEDSAEIKQIGQQKAKRNNPNRYRCYDQTGIAPTLGCMEGGGLEPHTAIPMTLSGHTAEEKKLSPCLNANDSRKVFGTGQPHAAVGVKMFGIDKNIQGTELECANALTAREDRGVSNFKQTGTAIAVTVGYDRGLNEITSDVYPTCNARDYKGVNFRDLGAVCIPVLTPDRTEKRQNGRRFKDNGEEAFTLTAQDRHGVAVKCMGGLQEHQRWRTDGISPCLTSAMGMGGGYVPVIWYEKYNCYIAIRKLTPKECFRLQGWTDDYFEKAQFVNSDSQLYKQAGNGVTVNVVEDIARAIGDV